jgi:hypothetical protein
MAQLQTQPGGIKLQHVLRGEVQDLLDRLAHARMSGDGEALATLYEVPAIVIGADGVSAIDSPAQIADLFGAARRQYEARGVVGMRPDLIDLERIGGRLVIATVRWPYLDASGHELGAEASDYTLRRDDHGRLRVRAVLMRGTETLRS